MKSQRRCSGVSQSGAGDREKHCGICRRLNVKKKVIREGAACQGALSGRTGFQLEVSQKQAGQPERVKVQKGRLHRAPGGGASERLLSFGSLLFAQLIDGTVKNEKSDPRVKLKTDDRITLEGSTKKINNISILLRDLEFTDTGKYTCHAKNPKENFLEHQATIFLQVVDKRRQGVGGAREERGRGLAHAGKDL